MESLSVFLRVNSPSFEKLISFVMDIVFFLFWSPETLSEFGGQGFGVFKPALAELTVSQIAPISEKMNRLLDDSVEIDRILKKGTEQARARAEPVLAEVKKIVGFLPE